MNRVVFRSFLELQRRISGKLAATSQHRNVACDFCFRIIKSMGYLILGVIEERTDGVHETKQEQPDRSKRLFLYSFSQTYS